MGSPVFKKVILEQDGHIIHNYQSDDGEIGLEVIPAKALILDIKLLGRSILNGPKSSEEFEDNSLYKSAYLSPFPNRIKDGKFDFGDESFQLPINDDRTNNALHGLQNIAPFELVDESAGSSLRLVFEQNFQGEEKIFPFPYKLSVVINIDRFKCELTMQVQNVGTTEMPIGIGWHPYFTLQQKIDDCNLCIPNCKKIEIDDRMIPTGKKVDYKSFSKPKAIQDEKFDDAFVFGKDADFTSVTLENQDFKLRYYQETRDSKFNYLQIYIPDDRQSIAFEPMSCNIDAFNNKDGLVVLKPNKRFKARCGVSLTKI